MRSRGGYVNIMPSLLFFYHITNRKSLIMKTLILAVSLLLSSNMLIAQTTSYSIRTGYGGFVNLGGVVGIGVEARRNHFALNAAMGTLQGEVPERAKKIASPIDYNIGIRYYLTSKNIQPYLAINYGIADYEYSDGGPIFRKMHDFSFSVGIKAVFRGIFIDPYIATMPPILDKRKGVIREQKYSQTLGILLGYDF